MPGKEEKKGKNQEKKKEYLVRPLRKGNAAPIPFMGAMKLTEGERSRRGSRIKEDSWGESCSSIQTREMVSSHENRKTKRVEGKNSCQERTCNYRRKKKGKKRKKLAKTLPPSRLCLRREEGRKSSGKKGHSPNGLRVTSLKERGEGPFQSAFKGIVLRERGTYRKF